MLRITSVFSSWLFCLSASVPRVLKIHISGIAKASAVFPQKKGSCLTTTLCNMVCLSLRAGFQAFPPGFPIRLQTGAERLDQNRWQYGKLKTPLPALHLQSRGTRAMTTAGSDTADRYCQVQPDGCTAVPGAAACRLPRRGGGGGRECDARSFRPGCSALPAGGNERSGEQPGLPTTHRGPRPGSRDTSRPGRPGMPLHPHDVSAGFWWGVFLTLVTKQRCFF